MSMTGPARLASYQRQDQALALRRQGRDYRAIAEQVGYNNPAGAWRAVQAALVRVPAEDVQAVRQVELERLDDILAKAYALFDRDCPVVSNGCVITDLVDLAPKFQALQMMLKVSESRRAMLGLDAPKRSIVNVITEDAVDAEIRRLEQELGVGGAGGENPAAQRTSATQS